jgi:hypothetical protein
MRLQLACSTITARPHDHRVGALRSTAWVAWVIISWGHQAPTTKLQQSAVQTWQACTGTRAASQHRAESTRPSAGSCAGRQQCMQQNDTAHMVQRRCTAHAMGAAPHKLTLPYVTPSTPHTGAYWAVHMQRGQGHAPQHCTTAPAVDDHAMSQERKPPQQAVQCDELSAGHTHVADTGRIPACTTALTGRPRCTRSLQALTLASSLAGVAVGLAVGAAHRLVERRADACGGGGQLAAASTHCMWHEIANQALKACWQHSLSLCSCCRTDKIGPTSRWQGAWPRKAGYWRYGDKMEPQPCIHMFSC